MKRTARVFWLAMLLPSPVLAVTPTGSEQAREVATAQDGVAPALYAVQFRGLSGGGRGSIYVGHGILSGVDVTGGTYDGSYVVNEGRLYGTATMRALGNSRMVTGQGLGDGETLPIRFELPLAIDERTDYAITVGGQPVRIRLTKVRDLP